MTLRYSPEMPYRPLEPSTDEDFQDGGDPCAATGTAADRHTDGSIMPPAPPLPRMKRHPAHCLWAAPRTAIFETVQVAMAAVQERCQKMEERAERQ